MRRYRSYKFTDKHHSQGGIRSSIAGGIALICTGISLYIAYAAKGNGDSILVLFGTVGIICCFYGAYIGGKSFHEEECYYLFSKIGTIVNVILMVFWIAVVGMGMLI